MKTRVSLVAVLCAGMLQVACSDDSGSGGTDMDTDPVETDGASEDGDVGADGDVASEDGVPGDGEDGDVGSDGDVGEDGTPEDGTPADGMPSEPCDGACAAGEVCNEETNVCEPASPEGCQGDDECPSGQVCNEGVCEEEGGCPGTNVAGLTVTRVAVNQAVDVPVVANGQVVPTSERGAPIVQNRSALFRVSVTPSGDFVPTRITTEITLTNGGVDTKVTGRSMISDASDESTLDGTANVLVPADLIGPDTKYRIAFTQNRCDEVTGESKFPASGSLELAAKKTGPLKVVLVPYERAPFKLPVDEATMERVKQGLFAYYPVSSVELSLHEPIPVMNPQTDLTRILSHIRGVRAEENPPDDVFYFGMFTAANTMREFCGMGCIAGIATLGGGGAAGEAAERYGVGIGYLTDTETTSMGMPTTDIEISINVMAHELGHAHGRRHSPCGDAAGPDPRYPDPEADIDAYGYSLASGEFATPGVHKDLMSYCEPQWISSYTYNALATRVTNIAAQNGGRVRLGPPTEYASLIVTQAGEATWGENVTLRLPPSGKPATAVARDATGTVIDAAVPVTLTELADLEGALVTLPVPGLTWASIELFGQTIAVK